MSRRILHLVEKRSVGRYCAGQWKDIQSFNEAFSSLDVEFDCLEFDYAEMGQLTEKCRNAQASDIILYYSFLPEVLKELRKQLPATKLYVRAVNAEAFQHWQRAEINLTPSYANLRSIYGAARFAWRDSQCKRIADGLLGISQWDNQAYWKRLPGKAQIHEVPYVSPWPALRPHVGPIPWARRKNEIVCLAGERDAIGRKTVEGFNRLAEELSASNEFSTYRFLLSPGIKNSKEIVRLSDHVEVMEVLDEPWDLLCSVKALAVLTPLGYGFKTTIADAMAAGCHVIVEPKLAGRLPTFIRNNCIVVDFEKGVQHSSIAQCLVQQPSTPDVNQALFQQATKGLRAALHISHT